MDVRVHLHTLVMLSSPVPASPRNAVMLNLFQHPLRRRTQRFSRMDPGIEDERRTNKFRVTEGGMCGWISDFGDSLISATVY
jgi:hypothetical protein